MEKVLRCQEVDPASGCREVIRGATEEEVMTKASQHARQHGIREVTPELAALARSKIRTE